MTATLAAPRETHGQTAHVASEKQARSIRARREEITEEIKRMRGFYSQKNAETPRFISYAAVKNLFDKIKKWARQERVIDASKRVETAAKGIEEAAEKLKKQKETIRENIMYMQTINEEVAEAP